MDTFEILTGQHVAIEYRPATIAQRLGALLIDELIKASCATAIILLFFTTEYIFYDEWAVVFFIVLLLPLFTYHFFFEWLMNGQTPGKRLLRIRVTNDDGSATRVGAYFLRWLLRPVDMTFGIGALFILFTRKQQCIGDLAAGTAVIQTRPRQENTFRPDRYTFPSNYTPDYPQAAGLTPGQARLIAGMLAAPPRRTDRARFQPLILKVCEALQLDDPFLPCEYPRDFLEAVLRDYHYGESEALKAGSEAPDTGFHY